MIRGDLSSTPEAIADGSVNVQVGEIEQVELSQLVLNPSVREGGPDERYARTLAEVGKKLPAILVHRESMVVLDGVHRVLAARRRGRTHVDVRYVHGSESDAFVVAVRANTAFGKPLTMAERQRCARRILRTHPHWSDRAIAESCGLSGKTVGNLRARSTEEILQLNRSPGQTDHVRGEGNDDHRIGRDGKARPVNAYARREQAARLLRASPQSSLRAVAREVGLSPATVKDVRDRLVSGDPGPEQRAEVGSEAMYVGGAHSRVDQTVEDTALRAADDGAAFIAWLTERRISAGEWERFVRVIPVSRIYIVADEARKCAAEWQKFAEAIESRVSSRR